MMRTLQLLVIVMSTMVALPVLFNFEYPDRFRAVVESKAAMGLWLVAIAIAVCTPLIRGIVRDNKAIRRGEGPRRGGPNDS